MQVLHTVFPATGCDFTLFVTSRSQAVTLTLSQPNLCLGQKTSSSDLYLCIIKKQLLINTVANKLSGLVIKTTVTALKTHLKLLVSVEGHGTCCLEEQIC